MGNSQVMPKVDFEKENLKKEHVYSRFLEAKNMERYAAVRAKIRNKRLTLATCAALVTGIYFYTIHTIKEESFLDDFDEPLRVNPN